MQFDGIMLICIETIMRVLCARKIFNRCANYHKISRYLVEELWPRRHINFVHVFCIASVAHLNTEYVDMHRRERENGAKGEKERQSVKNLIQQTLQCIQIGLLHNSPHLFNMELGIYFYTFALALLLFVSLDCRHVN